ncbi:MAG: head GIN domain-containing protein [Bacteroidota bacterium]
MLKVKFVFFAIAIIVFSSGCHHCLVGEGEVTQEKRSVLEFDVIEIHGSFDVILKQSKGKVNSVEITAQENLIPNILTNVSNEKLELQAMECMQSKETVTVQVNVTDLQKITLDGSGDVSTLGTLDFEALKIVNDGSGNVSIKVNVEELDVILDGSGDINLSGVTNEVDIENNGSGSISTTEMKAAEAIVQNDGSGKIQFFANEKMDIELNGSGDIEYLGNPGDFKQDNTGSGSIRSMN